MDSILFNGRVTTLDPAKPSASAVAIDSGVFVAVGSYREIMALRGAKTKVLDLRGGSLLATRGIHYRRLPGASPSTAASVARIWLGTARPRRLDTSLTAS